MTYRIEFQNAGCSDTWQIWNHYTHYSRALECLDLLRTSPAYRDSEHFGPAYKFRVVCLNAWIRDANLKDASYVVLDV